MKEDRIRGQIERATKSSGKRYVLDDDHSNEKPIDLFFQQTPEGDVLFVVFYSLACRYSACTGCNLPATSSSKRVDYRSLMAQIDHVFADPRVLERAASLRKVIVSNQGSVLDEETFSSTALMYLVAKINLHLPALTTLCLETRPEYVEMAELEFLARSIREAHDPRATVELAIGFEAYDERIRNRMFRKGLSFAAFERLAALVAEHRFKLKCYFMQKPVTGMSDEDAVVDVHDGIRYFAEIAEEHGIQLNMHLNPTYVARGTPLEQAFHAGDYTPPELVDLARAALAAAETPVSIFLGLNDEGLAVEGGSFIRAGDEPLLEELVRFNASQGFDALRRAVQQNLRCRTTRIGQTKPRPCGR